MVLRVPKTTDSYKTINFTETSTITLLLSTLREPIDVIKRRTLQKSE